MNSGMDLDAICSGVFSGDQTDGARGLVKEHLKLRVKKSKDGKPDIAWTALDPLKQSQGLARKINVENKTGGADVFSNVKTTKDNEMVIRVTLKSGYLKGYNKKMSLPLPTELQSLLGKTVAIDPSKEESEIKDKMTIETISGHDIPPADGAKAATATIRNKQGHYQGHFRTTVVLTGTVQKVVNNGAVEQADIGEIIRRSVFPDRQDDAKGATWPMEGYLDVTWDDEQTVTWEPIQTVKK